MWLEGIMKNKIMSGLAAAAVLVGIGATGGTVANAAGGGGVYHYESLSACDLAVDKLAQRYTIVQGCTADVYQNGVPVRWRVIFE